MVRRSLLQRKAGVELRRVLRLVQLRVEFCRFFVFDLRFGIDELLRQLVGRGQLVGFVDRLHVKG